jgi:hypothetical protein
VNASRIRSRLHGDLCSGRYYRVDTTPETSIREHPAAADGWFEALPEEHRQRIVEEDEAQLLQWEEVGRRERLGWRSPVLHGALLLGSISAFVTALSPAAALAGLISGALAGWLWHRTGAQQILSPLIAVPLFYVGLIATGQLTLIALIWAPLPIGIVSLWLGMRRSELPGC